MKPTNEQLLEHASRLIAAINARDYFDNQWLLPDSLKESEREFIEYAATLPERAPQVMGRVGHLEDGSVVCWLNSNGKALPDNTPLYATLPAESPSNDLQPEISDDAIERIFLANGFSRKRQLETESLQLDDTKVVDMSRKTDLVDIFLAGAKFAHNRYTLAAPEIMERRIRTWATNQLMKVVFDHNGWEIVARFKNLVCEGLVTTDAPTQGVTGAEIPVSTLPRELCSPAKAFVGGNPGIEARWPESPTPIGGVHSDSVTFEVGGTCDHGQIVYINPTNPIGYLVVNVDYSPMATWRLPEEITNYKPPVRVRLSMVTLEKDRGVIFCEPKEAKAKYNNPDSAFYQGVIEDGYWTPGVGP